MASVSSDAGDASGVHITRPLVIALFIASCLLSIVSWYTTQQGMALYLAPWFAILASLGVQAALVFVAWLIGFTKEKRGLLVGVYVITAIVSISFSYVSLFTWFSARERPATIERKLYDQLNADAAKAGETLTASIAEQEKHVLALEEMTAAEKANGYISRAQDADPYLAKVREAVAKEAQSYSTAYQEGSGGGLRYTAFDRYTKMAQQSLEREKRALVGLTNFRTQLKPLDPSEQQIRLFRQAYDEIPWTDVSASLHDARLEKPPAPAYSDFVDRTVSGQEDMLVAFQELFTAPTSRHLLSFLLAAFIDVVVFLLAFASGPYFFGTAEQRWLAAGATLDALDRQVFVSSFLQKMKPGPRGMASVDVSALTSGEQQICMLLTAKGLAVVDDSETGRRYLIDAGVHERMLEAMSKPQFPLRAKAGQQA